MTDIVDLAEWKKAMEERGDCPADVDKDKWNKQVEALIKEQLEVFHAGGNIHVASTGMLTMLSAYSVLQPNSDRGLSMISTLLALNKQIVHGVTVFSNKLQAHIDNIEKARQAGIWRGAKGRD